jgi:octaprenyl-diphosphate synthase
MTQVTSQSQSASLESEVRAVFRTLEEAINELYAPLGELVHGQLTQGFVPVRTGVILAASAGAFDTAELREQRICLAAALEMLHIALSIHKLLIADPHLHDLDNAEKSRIGSIILAGDYCFSRSAILAARTDSPQVVEQFAIGLKIISERRLRRLFKQDDGFQEEQMLIETGLTAALILANSSPELASLTFELGRQILSPGAHQEVDATQSSSLFHKLVSWQQRRWQALLERDSSYDSVHQ